jgi:signal transduction histidine kinase
MKSKQMKNVVAMVVIAAALAGGAAWAADRGTAKEAEALVKKGIAYIKANGKDKGYAEISNKQGQFVDRDLYLIVLQVDGTMLANGANAKLIGLNRMDSQVMDGKFAIREMIEASKSKNGSWTEYKYSDPVTRKVMDKANYCERLDPTTLVCGGYYKS